MSVRSRHFRKPIVFFFVSAVGISMLGAMSNGQAVGAELASSENVVSGTIAAPPALSLAVNALSPGRIGGRSSLEIEMASTTPGGHAISGLETKIAVPRHARIRAVHGAGWRCRLGFARAIANCSHPRTLGRDERPSPIHVQLAYAPGVGKSATVMAWSRWNGERRREGDWVTAAQARVTVLPKLQMSLHATASTITTFVNGGADQRQFLLQANLRGLRDEPATLTWKQLSGPRVRFLLPRVVEHMAASVDQRVAVPRLRRAHRYVFAARVQAQGEVVTRRVRVSTRGGSLMGAVPAATPSSAQIAGATQPLAPLAGSARIAKDHLFRIKGATMVGASEAVELHAAGPGIDLKSTVWTIDGEEIGRGAVVVVTAPAEPGQSRSVQAAVTLADGSVRVSSHLIVADSASSPVEEPLDPAAARTTFCRIATSIRSAQKASANGTRIISLGSTQRFQFPLETARLGAGVFSRSGSCTGKGDIELTGASLNHSQNVRLGQVAATLTPDALTITAARMTVNSTVSNRLTDRIGLRLVGELKSSLTSTGFESVSGAMTFVPFSIGDRAGASPFSMFLDLPRGWEYLPDASRVYFLNGGSTGIDADVKDGTVRIAQIATSPPNAGGERGQVAFGIDVLADTATQVSVTVANLGLGQTPRGGQLEANGHFGVQLTEKKFVLHLDVSCVPGWAARECALFTGLRFSKFQVDWSAEELAITAEAAIDAGGEHTFGLAFAGTYRSELDWDLAVTNPEPWQLGKGMTFESLNGSLVSRASASDPEVAVVTFDVSGSFKGLTLSDAITVDHVSPRLTNACPTDDAKCSTTELKLFFTASISADSPWSDTPIRFDARGKLNFTSMTFRFESGVSNANVGPADLKLQDLRVVVSNEGRTQCVPDTVDDEDIPTGQYTLQFIGKATILAKDFTLNVQSDSRGLCIWGSGESINIGGGLKAVAPLMTYTTFTDGAKITEDSGQTVEVKPGIVSLRGGFEFPDAFKQRFQVPGKGVVFNAALSTDLASGHFSVSYNAAGEIVLYQGDGADLALGSIGFGLDFSTGVGGKKPSFDGYFYGTGHLRIDEAGSTPASSTELAVRVGVGYSGTAFTLTMQAGVPSDAPVENAFGIEGLTVRALSASAAIDLVSGTPAFGLNADVTLPPGMLSSVGIAAGTPIVLAANLSAASPCLEFQVGSSGGPQVVDLGGLGFVTGTYLRIMYAPLGCKVPDGYQTRELDAGWSLALEGSLLGGPVTLASTFTYSTAGFTMNATVRLPNWNLYGVALQSADGTAGPTFVIAIDTEKGEFSVDIDAGIELGKVSAGRGVLVALDGDVTMESERFVVDLEGKGIATLGPVKLALDPVSLDANIPRPGKSSAENALFVEVSTDLLASLYFAQIRASGDLTIMGSTVVDLTVKGEGSFDLAAYAVRGTVAFDLCTGTLSEIKADGTGSECTLFDEGRLATSKPAIRVGVTGVQDWVGREPVPFAKLIYDRAGVEA